MKRFMLRIGLCLITPLALCGVGEWMLRDRDWGYVPRTQPSVLWSPGRDRALSSNHGDYEFHPHQLWSPRPNAPLSWAPDEHVNADGYRGPLVAVRTPPKTLRIVFLGGATTLGVGVRFEEALPALTARLVTQRIVPCEAMNLGVQNFSVRQCLERYRDLARPYQGQVIVLALTAASACAPAPGGISDHEKIELVRPLDVQRRPESPITGSASRLVQGIEWVRDAIEGRYWEAREEDYRLMRLEPTYGGLDWPGTRRIPIDDFHEALALLRQETHQDSAHFILITIPPPRAFPMTPIAQEYERVVTNLAEREGLVHIDEHNAPLDALRDELHSQDAFGADVYPSECGQYLLAEALVDVIVRGIQARANDAPYKKPEPPPK